MIKKSGQTITTPVVQQEMDSLRMQIDDYDRQISGLRGEHIEIVKKRGEDEMERSFFTSWLGYLESKISGLATL